MHVPQCLQEGEALTSSMNLQDTDQCVPSPEMLYDRLQEGHYFCPVLRDALQPTVVQQILQLAIDRENICAIQSILKICALPFLLSDVRQWCSIFVLGTDVPPSVRGCQKFIEFTVCQVLGSYPIVLDACNRHRRGHDGALLRCAAQFPGMLQQKAIDIFGNFCGGVVTYQEAQSFVHFNLEIKCVTVLHPLTRMHPFCSFTHSIINRCPSFIAAFSKCSIHVKMARSWARFWQPGMFASTSHKNTFRRSCSARLQKRAATTL